MFVFFWALPFRRCLFLLIFFLLLGHDPEVESRFPLESRVSGLQSGFCFSRSLFFFDRGSSRSTTFFGPYPSLEQTELSLSRGSLFVVVYYVIFLPYFSTSFSPISSTSRQLILKWRLFSPISVWFLLIFLHYRSF